MEINPMLTAEEFEAITDEDVKALYKPKDDGFIVDIKGVLSAKEATKRKYEAEKAKSEEYFNKYESLKVFEGKDPEQVETALKTLTKAEEKKLIDKGEFEKIRLKDKEEFEKKFNETMTVKEQEANQWKSAFEREFINNKVLAELVKQGVLTDGEAANDAVQLFMPRVKLDIKDGKPTHKIIDATGYDTGKTLEEAVLEYKQERPYLFASNLASGTGATPSGTSGGSGASKKSEMTREQKVAYIRKHGQAKYEQLPD